MKFRETVYYHARPVGRVCWDGRTGSATFTALDDALRPLESKSWPCPVECREAVLVAAERAGVFQ